MDMMDFLAPGDWITSRGGPLYLQLRRRLEQGIISLGLDADAALPSERDVARQTGLSRVTVRKALEALAATGLVVQRQGAGSFVAPKPRRMEQSLSQLTSFSEDMARRGMATTTLWLERGICLANAHEVVTLQLQPDEYVARLARLRMADDQALAIERASLPARILPNPLGVEGSLYQYLQSQGHRPVRALQRISATNVLGADADFLEVELGEAGLQIERVSYLADGRPVEMVRSLYRGDAYDFVAELRLGEGGR
jgi:GntR family transcriptional regulator